MWFILLIIKCMFYTRLNIFLTLPKPGHIPNLTLSTISQIKRKVKSILWSWSSLVQKMQWLAHCVNSTFSHPPLTRLGKPTAH